MKTSELIGHLKESGQFKLKSGKTIFGVIWKAIPNSDTLYFASNSNYEKIISAHSLLKQNLLSKHAYIIDANDIVSAQFQLKEVG